MDFDIPRDGNGRYGIKVIRKYQNTITQDIERKFISMYAKGMTTSYIKNHFQEFYGIESIKSV